MNSFEETFAIKRNDTNSNLPLTKKMKVFLLQTFKNTYTKLGESKNIQTVKGKGRRTEYYSGQEANATRIQ